MNLKSQAELKVEEQIEGPYDSNSLGIFSEEEVHSLKNLEVKRKGSLSQRRDLLETKEQSLVDLRRQQQHKILSQICQLSKTGQYHLGN